MLEAVEEELVVQELLVTHLLVLVVQDYQIVMMVVQQ